MSIEKPAEADSKNSKIASNSVAAFTWGTLFLVAGLVYEVSYFLTLGISAFSTLSVRHYIYSGFTVMVLPTVLLAAFALIKKFFSKHVARDDSEALFKAAKDFGFARSLQISRLALLSCFCIWMLAIFENRIFENQHTWLGVPWLSLFVVQAFFFALYTSPSTAITSVAFAFTLSISLCISIWAIGSARFDMGSNPSTGALIRDDVIVRITRHGNSFNAEAKPFKLPLPFLDKVMDLMSGDSK